MTRESRLERCSRSTPWPPRERSRRFAAPPRRPAAGSARSLADAGQQRAHASEGARPRDRSRAHAPASDHHPGDPRQLLDVRFGAGRQIAEHQLLGDPATQRHLDLSEQMALVEIESVRVGGREGHAQSLAAGDDRHLPDGIGAGGEHADDRVSGLVVGGAATVVFGDHHLARGAEHDPLEGVAEVLARHRCGRAWPPAARPRWRRWRGRRRPCPGSRRRSRRGRRPASSGTERVWTRRIASRPARSGGDTTTRRSKRPGRSRAWSSTSGRLVAPSTITLARGPKPSISVRIWLSVCSRSSWPPESWVRRRRASARRRRARR